jgi:lipopolysaccharide export system permease protein
MLIGRTLGLYLSVQFGQTILVVFGTVFALVYTLDFVEVMRRVGDTAGATPALVAQLSLYRTPAIAEQVFPFAILFGSMASLLQLSRKLELVVARSAGISAWQFLQPGIGVALLIGIVAVTIYNPVSAALKSRASEIEATIFSRKAKGLGPELWLRQRSPEGQAVIRAEGAVEGTTAITSVTAFTFDLAGRFRNRIEAAEGVLRDGYWELRDARIYSTDQEPRSLATYRLASNLDQSQVRQSFTSPESVPFWRLPDTIRRTELAGLDPARYRMQFAILLARPLLFVAMVLVAASVSLRFFRFGGVSRMVLGGVAAGFALYVATELMRGLGNSGIVGPAVAAWGPALFGSLLGILALLYQEDG